MLSTKNTGALSGALVKKENGMVKVKILKDTMCEGERCREGDVVEISQKSAHYLLGIKKAEPYGGSKEKPKTKGKK